MVALGEWNSLDPNLQNLEVEGFLFGCLVLFFCLFGCVFFFYLLSEVKFNEVYKVKHTVN